MAVIVKYVVVRDGVEKMTFTTKKEADAYDKMLDIAENFQAFLEDSDLEIPENLLEPLSLFISENRDQVGTLLKGGALKPKAEKPEPDAGAPEPKKAGKTPKAKAAKAKK